MFVCIYREHCNFSEIKTLERNGLQSQLGHEATDSISQHAYLIHKGVEKLVEQLMIRSGSLPRCCCFYDIYARSTLRKGLLKAGIRHAETLHAEFSWRQ